MRRSWKRLATDNKGAAMVEFALVLPFLMLFLGGIIQLGSLFFVQLQMSVVAQDAARRLSVSELTTDEAEAYAVGQLPKWAKGYLIDATEVDDDVSVVISIPMSEAMIITFSHTFSGKLEAQAVLRKEA